MQVRILTYHMESLELKNTLSEIGAIVHSINTIAVSLSLMPNEGVSVPESLNISWKPSNIELSKKEPEHLLISPSMSMSPKVYLNISIVYLKILCGGIKTLTFKDKKKKQIEYIPF